MDIVISKSGVPIRLTDERWFHIVENHDEVAGYYDEVLEAIESPEIILRGYGGAPIAVKPLGRRKYLVVIYRVITAYFTSQISRGLIKWQKGQP